MTGDEEAGLLAAIAQAPSDMGARLVYADWLLANSDERGELITYDEADRRGHFQRFVDDPALYRFMELAARYGFMRMPEDPDDALLWSPAGAAYECVLDKVAYRAHAEYGRWYVGLRGQNPTTDSEYMRFPNDSDFTLYHPTEWKPREVDVVLSISSRAIRMGQNLRSIVVPYREAIDELDRLCADRPAPGVMFGVVDYERWGILWQRWFRRP